MYRRNSRAVAARLGQVLAGLAFPAAKWQLIMYAEDYGADAESRVELWSLPAGSYADLHTVFAALGVARPRPWTGYQVAPGAQAAGRGHPAHH